MRRMQTFPSSNLLPAQNILVQKNLIILITV